MLIFNVSDFHNNILIQFSSCELITCALPKSYCLLFQDILIWGRGDKFYISGHKVKIFIFPLLGFSSDVSSIK